MSTEENNLIQQITRKSPKQLFADARRYNELIESGRLDGLKVSEIVYNFFSIQRLSKTEKYFTHEILDLVGRLNDNLEKILPQLANYFNCRPEEINLKCASYEWMNNQPYVAVFGIADFEDSRINDIGNLRVIGGDARFGNSLLSSLGHLQVIGGNVYFDDESNAKDLGELQWVGGDVYFFGERNGLEELFYSQFEKDGDGWRRKLTAKVDNGLNV